MGRHQAADSSEEEEMGEIRADNSANCVGVMGRIGTRDPLLKGKKMRGGESKKERKKKEKV